MSSDSALTPVGPFVKKAGLIAALLFSGGCETIVELSDLMDGLVQEFDLTSETVGLMLSRGGGTATVGGAGQSALELEPNDGPGILTVTVTDSTTLRLPDEARQELANRMAGFVRDHFELYGELVRVRISFVEVQKIVFFFGLFYDTEATHRGTLDLSTDSLELYLAVRQSVDLVELGRPEEALAVLDAALRLDPNFSPAQDVRAAARLMLDRTAEAAPTDDLGATDPTQPRIPPGLEEPTVTPTDDLGAADPTQPRILPGLEEPTFTLMTVRPEITNRNEVIQASPQDLSSTRSVLHST